MATKEERDIAKLEVDALKEYTSAQELAIAQNKARIASEVIPPELAGMDLRGTSIGSMVEAEVQKATELPPINTEEGMKFRGLIDENGEATKLGEDYLLMEDSGLIQDGELTKKGKAFLTPKEDLLDPDGIINFKSSLDFNDPARLEKLELYKIRKDSGIDEEDKEESFIKSVIGLVPEVAGGLVDIAKTTGTAVGMGEATPEQRAVATGAIVEGAIETPVQGIKKGGTFVVKNVINPIKRAAGVPEEELELDALKRDYEDDSRALLNERTNAAALIDAITDTTRGSEIYQTAKQQYIDQYGEVEGEQKFNNLVAGGMGAGSMGTDPLGLALAAVTAGGSVLPKLAKTTKIAKAEATALTASSQLERLGEASALVGRQIDDATAQIGVLQKSLDDALKVGDDVTATSLSNEVRAQSARLDDLNKRATMLDEGAQVNQKMLQQASTKIDDINAPSMLGRRVQSGAIRGLANTADVLGKVAAGTNKTLRYVERKIGMGRLPWLAHLIGLGSLGTGYAVYGGARLGSLLAAPVLKKTARFANTISDELLEATSTNPFWRRVAANESTGRLGQAFAGLMDYTTPIRRGIASPIKGAAQVLPATTLYEAINAGGLDQAALERAGANAIVFGPIARFAGGKKDWDQASAGDLYNFRNKLRSTDQTKFEAFESIPDKQTRQFISSFDAAYPGMFEYNFTQEGNSFFDYDTKSPTFKTATINVNDKPGMIKALAGHEINHALQFKHQSDDAVRARMLGDETQPGLVRNTDGTLDPEFKAWGDEYNSRLRAQDIPEKSIEDLAIEYYTDIGAQTLFEDVVSGRVYKAAQKTKVRRKIEEMFNKTMSATPIIKDLHFKLGGATDGTGRMIMGSGLLADGIREIPEVKAMVRNMYRESAGLPSKSQVSPNDLFGKSKDPIHHQAGEAIRDLNKQAVRNKTPLIDGALQPDARGNGIGRLPSEYFEELEARGIIPEGSWGRAVDINENMDNAVSYLLDYRPIRQGRSEQIDGRTLNNIKPIDWVLYDGRLYLAAMDLNQLNINVNKAAQSKVAKQLKMSKNDIMNDIDAVADLHAKGKSTDDYFKRVSEEAGYGKKWKSRKNFINATQGLLTPEQAAGNPMFNALRQTKKSGIYRTFAFDLLDNATRMTGVKVVDYGPNSYYNLKQNLMPQMPRVNRNGELVTKTLTKQDVNTLPKSVDFPENASGSRIKTQLKFSKDPVSFQFKDGIIESPNVRYLPKKVYHGTPYKVDRFNIENVGTGEGAQAYGWGLYFAESPDVANYYAAKVGSKPSKELLVEIVNSKLQDMTVLAKKMRSEGKSEKLIAEAERLGSRKKGNLYVVEIKSDSNKFLDWDKPLKEQSKNIQELLAKFDPDSYSPNSENYDANELGQLTYSRINGTPKEKSQKLLSSGINGIRYFDGESRSRPYNEIKKDFLSELPQDASIEDVLQAIDDGVFKPEQVSFLKALEDDDWFGFEYPSQAISAALSDNITNWDPSPNLIDSIKPLRNDVTYNYVVFDDADIKIIKENEQDVSK